MAASIPVSLRYMRQPASLKTDEYCIWSGGRGEDVWAMLWAAATGDLDTIRRLVTKEPALIRCQMEYFTPLRFAVRENQRAVIEYLLAAGADAHGEAGDNLVTVARDRGYDELADYLASLIEEKYNVNPAGDMIAAAIKAYDMPRVRTLLEENPAMLHAADTGGSQPIHWAALTRQIELIDYLLDHGVDINTRRPDGARPLDLTNGDYNYRSWYRDLPPTALRKHEMLVGYLIARGAYCDISVAAKMGWLDRVRTLVEEDPGVVNRVPPYDGYYSGLPLRCAAGAGHIAVVRYLLEHGANPNEPEPFIAPLGGALHAAIGGRHYEVVKLLLEHGANPNAPVESSGNCASMVRFAGAGKDMARLIASYGGVMGVELTCHEGDVELLAAMLHANPQLDLGAGIGTLIGRAHRDCLELVLRYQPDILRTKGQDANAWWNGAVPKDADFARWLIRHGLDLKRSNWLGITTLHRCAGSANMEIAAICLEQGADISTPDALDSSTPLGWAAREGKASMAEWLLAQGADPAQPVEAPWAQPLAWARRRGHKDIITLLKEK
ncbi:MAG: ankyrin repeat domain-containing protein [Bacteroidetes bacterium]|nr:ankyrin repeat domain-containing protein [Bacteroidota bacterium]